MGLFSECHAGITSTPKIYNMLDKLREAKPDIIVNCGDDCGTYHGHQGVRVVAKACREVFAMDFPILHVMGNHDYWSGHGGMGWSKNLWLIRQCLAKHNIVSLDEVDYFRFKDCLFFGNSGWYTNPNPPTNDRFFVPKTFYRKPMYKTTLELKTRKVMETINLAPWKQDNLTPVFVSHFPLIPASGIDWKGRFEEFSWDDAILRNLLIDQGVRHFLCGHAHQLHQGPLRYEAGADYYNPNFIIIEIK